MSGAMRFVAAGEPQVMLPAFADEGARITVNGAVWEWRQGWCLILHALGWFTVTGRGEVATIASEELPPGPADGSDLRHRRVNIDGSMYTVAGVEWCLVNHTGRCPRGYGLLVRPAVSGEAEKQ